MLVPVGVVGRAHGLNGEMCVHLHDPTSHSLFNVEAVVIAPREPGDGDRYVLASARPKNAGIIIKLQGIATRDQAEALRGRSVMVARADLPATDENEFYDCDLQGMEVRTTDGAPLGRVVAVEHPPANDVLVVELAGRGAFLDVPMIEGVVLAVAVEDRAITVDVPDGLPTRARR